MRFPLINNANYRNIIEQENVTSTVSTPFNLLPRMLRKDNMDFNKIWIATYQPVANNSLLCYNLILFVIVSITKVFVLKCKYV